ncbi:MAG: polysaccharide biosynthesis protein [Microbacteriaceae bacterium]|nr:polysaccharide biosynthesis protein [Microbacteriaceae bacterium]
MVKKILHDKNSEYYPVGFIDDDGLKKNRELDGFPVLGNRSDLIQVAKATNAEALVISVLNLDREVMADLTKMASQANLKLYISPTLKEVTEEGAALNDFRDIDISDFIGRSPLNLDTSTISSYITGARVLVTGAGGSIGSVLAKQVYKFGPSELMLLDRDESALQSTELDVFGNGLLNTKEVILADIRDQESLQKIFDERKPQVVFHTAALKHLPMLEQFPTESWKTNVLGTLNVLEAAMKAGVETFVNISTDKAANPTSFLGLSKRYGERLTSWFADKSGKRYISVRFGNVLGSRGSLIPTLFSLIEQNKPLTITHPDATRYFMTIPEACQLVIQAGGIARPGELLILDMGEPVRIQDIAEKMLQFSRKKLDIVYTGLRQGEKLHEELSGEGENLEKPFHPKISHTIIPNLSPKTLNLEVFLSRSEESNND